MGDLVKIVPAAVGDVFLQAGDSDTCLVSVGRTLPFPVQPPLQQDQTAQASLQVLGVFKYTSEQTASDLMPRSTPTAVVSRTSVASISCMPVSTRTETKYLPEGVRLAVTAPEAWETYRMSVPDKILVGSVR